MNTRVEEWPSRLAAFIEQRRRTPFAWGVHDCCQFARAAVRIIRGRDITLGRRLGLRRYRTARTGLKLLEQLGGVAAIPARCGLAEINVKLAQRGDVVSAPFPAGDALGVCLGQDSAFPGERGLLFIPTLECQRAWRV
jgi:hypothetical protein